MSHQAPHKPLYPHKGSAYIPEIDGLRAFAVLSVIFYHLDLLPGGFLGVDLFFVISGFVVSAAQSRRGEVQKVVMISFVVDFYARRMRRILPALLVVLVSMSLLSAWFIPASWLSDANEKTGLYAFFGLSNWILTQIGDDYFSPRSDFNPYTHTWSLGVEEQFYLIFPFLFLFWSTGRTALAIVIYATLALFSLSAAIVWAKRDVTLAWYLIFTRFWELAAGVLLYQFLTKFPNAFITIPTVGKTMIAMGSIGLIASGWVMGQPLEFPLPWTFGAVLGTTGLLAVLVSPRKGKNCEAPNYDGQSWWEKNSWLNWGLSRPWGVFVGQISYSLYLWHWPIIVLLRWTVGMDSWPNYLIALVLTFLCATLSYYWIEYPIRCAPALHRWPAAVILWLGVGAIALGYGVSAQISNQRWELSWSVTRNREVWYPDRFDPHRVSRCPLRITDQMREGGVFLYRLIPECGDSTPKRRLFVAGDSHAGAYVPLLQRFSAEQSVELRLYMRAGCPYLNLLHRNDEVAQCVPFTKIVTEEVRQHAQPGDIFFLPSLRLVRLIGQWDSFPEEAVRAAMFGPEASQKRTQAVDEAVALLRPLAQQGIRIVFEAPKPLFRAPPFRCSDWFNRKNPICRHGFTVPRRELLDYRQPVMEALAELVQRIPSVEVWDPFLILCPQDPCTALHQGQPLFFDGDHLSGYGNQVLYDSFQAFLRRQDTE